MEEKNGSVLFRDSKTCNSVQMLIFIFTFSHLADAFIHSDLEMRTMEAIKINKRAMICECYYIIYIYYMMKF